MQIRDGLHVFGRAPEGELLDELLRRARARLRARRGAAKTNRCCARSPPISSSASTR